MIRHVHRVGGQRWGSRVPAWPPSPESCTCFRKFLTLISSPSDAANPRFFGKSYGNGKKLPKCLQKFFTQGVEYDTNSWVTEGFDPSIQSLIEEKLHCKRPKGQLVDCPLSGQWTPSAGDKQGASTRSRFLQRILPAPGSRCTGTSWPGGCICISVFNSSRWAFLP